ncbi:hypothetical protein COX03_03135 [Candidatus Woesebacteria bacterium CG22_combo_CG10-13_8_21_14_all_39_10]|uniref:Uncharacterized protein n=2 Tax=Candidatus Woeseibacteriota TaxID=1752722 RepID=A0A2H0BK89_9BACT|nr:MAG: hypothetical protein COX03_03135 [Candidatus Woesebacteria bacterium CG22_combo_CG10-13_8_21_14_all_39_10]PIZ46876.1 MAG: hypothetical protein COY29_05945 [Candidatus Woesebacteria bacterium CG_4_10_14_0_2_um_filter_39_14]
MVSGGRFANTDKSRLFAEFFSNIAVAWFAGGVIGVFIGNVRTPREIVFSLSWGILFSSMFLLAGAKILERSKQ